MNPFSYVSGLVGRFRGSKKPAAGGSQVPKGFPAYVGGGGPGGWASNHWTESGQCVGWSFIAIRAVAKACARATPMAYATGDRARQFVDRAIRKHRKQLITQDELVRVKSGMSGSESGDDMVPLPPTFPLNRLLRKPNPWMSKAEFLYQHAQQSCITGTTLLWVRRNNYRAADGKGTPARLYIVPTGVCTPLPPSLEMPAGGYRVMPVGSFGGLRPDADVFGDASWTNVMVSGGVLSGEEVTPVRWPHPVFLTDGLSPMAAGSLWIDIANSIDRATAAGMVNTLRPGYIFQQSEGYEEPTREEADRFDAMIQRRVGGLDNVGRHLRLPKGVAIADADRSVQELGYVEGRQSVGRDVLSLWAVPPVATGHQEAGAYAAYYASLLQFTEQAVDPVLSLLANALERELVPAFGDDLEIRIPAPPVNDKEQRRQELALLAQYGAITNNELRQAYRLRPWTAEEGGDRPVDTGTDESDGGIESKPGGSDNSGQAGRGAKIGQRQPTGTGPASKPGPANPRKKSAGGRVPFLGVSANGNGYHHPAANGAGS
ncbi:MAG: phage portal protein [Gemmataceae bacterium]|nr:phage portal protein [Gemmataceae bacterium]